MFPAAAAVGATVHPIWGAGIAATPLAVVRAPQPEHPVPSQQIAQEIALRLDAGTLHIDCPCCGTAMLCKRDKRGFPFSYCGDCRLQIGARTTRLQAWWLALAAVWVERQAQHG
jgi:hypothetical protein